jgi:serine protease SohB
MINTSFDTINDNGVHVTEYSTGYIATNYAILFSFLLLFSILFMCIMLCCGLCCRSCFKDCCGSNKKNNKKEQNYFKRRFDVIEYESIYTNDKAKMIKSITSKNKAPDTFFGIDKRIASKLENNDQYKVNAVSKKRNCFCSCCRCKQKKNDVINDNKKDNENKNDTKPNDDHKKDNENKNDGKIDNEKKDNNVMNDDQKNNDNKTNIEKNESVQKKKIYLHYSFDNMSEHENNGASTVLANINDDTKNVFRDLEAFVDVVIRIMDPSVVIVLLKISSPGGYAYQFELAYTHLIRLKKAGFRLIGLVDDICASGGYMLACACDTIISAKYAILGSIGVVTTITNYYELAQKIGLSQKTITTGSYKRPCPPGEPLDSKDIDRVNESVQDSLIIFKEIVQKSRNLSEDELKDVLNANVWYGRKALEKRLVDNICSSNEYLNELSKNEENNQIFLVCHKSSKHKSPLLSILENSVKYSIERMFMIIVNIVRSSSTENYNKIFAPSMNHTDHEFLYKMV